MRNKLIHSNNSKDITRTKRQIVYGIKTKTPERERADRVLKVVKSRDKMEKSVRSDKKLIRITKKVEHITLHLEIIIFNCQELSISQQIYKLITYYEYYIKFHFLSFLSSFSQLYLILRSRLI